VPTGAPFAFCAWGFQSDKDGSTDDADETDFDGSGFRLRRKQKQVLLSIHFAAMDE